MTKIRSTDDSRIQDRRGQGGGGMSIPGLGRGGGVADSRRQGRRRRADRPASSSPPSCFLPRLLGGGDGTEPDHAGRGPGAGRGGDDGEACQTEAEQIVCGANEDVQDYWERPYPQAFGQPYNDTELVFFSGGTNTGCGAASSQTGPFYCPADAPRVHRSRLHGPAAVRLRRPRRPGHRVHRRPRVRPPRAEPHRRRTPPCSRRAATRSG